MHTTRRTRRMALAIASAIAITGLAGAAPVGAVAGLGAPDLKAASDTGVSNTDNITKATSLTFTVTGTVASDVVELWRGATRVATGTAPAVGVLELTDGTAPEGSFDYTLVRGDEHSPATSVTIDLTGPDAPTLAPDLDAGSDSGSSATDDITNDTSPTFNLVEALPAGIAAIELVR